MRDYYPKTAALPQDVYNKTLWLVRGYDRLKEEAEALAQHSVVNDGQPRGSSVGDPTAAAAERRERIRGDLSAIEGGLEDIPEEYRTVVFDNVARQIPFSKIPEAEYASMKTWSKYRVIFLVGVARRAGYVE